jgi:hypothetical protein
MLGNEGAGMGEMIAATIKFLMQNFTLTLLVLGLLVAAAAMARSRLPVHRAVAVEKLLSWFVFFNIGVSYLYNFIMHGFFGAMAARFIGWADSPFQFEVATASLGFAVVGFIAAFRSFDLRLAAIVGPGIFTLGAAAGHIHEMITAHNFAPGNAGVIFWTDILIPAIGFLLLWLQSRYGRPGPAAAAARSTRLAA